MTKIEANIITKCTDKTMIRLNFQNCVKQLQNLKHQKRSDSEKKLRSWTRKKKSKYKLRKNQFDSSYSENGI